MKISNLLSNLFRGTIVTAAACSVAIAAAYTITSNNYTKVYRGPNSSGSYHDVQFFAADKTARCGAAAPTIQGFGTGAAVVFANGNCIMQVNVGTSNTGTGNVILPAAANGWHCLATDLTTVSATVFDTGETSSSNTTKAVLQNYSDAAATHAWADNDLVDISCQAA